MHKKLGFSSNMSKKIGALLALSIAFGAGGAQAARISETHLQKMMSSTATEAVLLESLRARDKDVLNKLAGSLADRYADLLSGSELVFTRLVEDGTIFYRLDFVNLRNRDRARALCHILEMNRCIARIGDDRMVVLDVHGEDAVTAIARMEQGVEEDVFTLAMREPGREANPLAREVEAKARKSLDPLTAFPQPRPDDLEQVAVNKAPSPDVPAAVSMDAPLETPGPAALEEPQSPPADAAGEMESATGAPSMPDTGLDTAPDPTPDPNDEAMLFPIPRQDALAGLDRDLAALAGHSSRQLDAGGMKAITTQAALAQTGGVEVAARFTNSDGKARYDGTRVAQVMADISTEKHLGRVTFDDRYATPSTIDFSGGSDSGDLQKLPIRRNRALPDASSEPARSAPIDEISAHRNEALLTSEPRAPYEVAQVPGMSDAPASQEEARDAARSQLSSLLSGEDEGPAPITPPAPVAATDVAEDQIFTTSAAGGRPGLNMPSEPKQEPAMSGPAPVQAQTTSPAAPIQTRPGAAPSSSFPAARPAPANPVAPSRSAPARPGISKAQPAAAGPSMTAPIPAQPPVQRPAFETAAKTAAEAPAKQAAPAAPDEADMQARRAQALEVLNQIVREGRTQTPVEPEPVPARMEQAADRQAGAAQAWRAEQTQARSSAPQVQMRSSAPQVQQSNSAPQVQQRNSTAQRRPAPRGPFHANLDIDAASEIAARQYVAQDNDRSDMQRRANPVRGNQAMRTSMSPRPSQMAPSELRIELSYVGSRAEVASRVEELKTFFPQVLLEKGRFFGASIPEQPHRYMVGIAATDAAARDALIWYLEAMNMPWAIR